MFFTRYCGAANVMGIINLIAIVLLILIMFINRSKVNLENKDIIKFIGFAAGTVIGIDYLCLRTGNENAGWGIVYGISVLYLFFSFIIIRKYLMDYGYIEKSVLIQ